jgi:hypothetical protein
MTARQPKIRIALKFCGSCNPEIDLSSLARQVKAHTAGRPDIEIVRSDSPGTDLLIILCGCLRACANKDEYKSQAGRNIIIAGQSLAGTVQNEDHLAKMVTAEIDRLPPAK